LAPDVDVRLSWPKGTIVRQWAQITVLPTPTPDWPPPTSSISATAPANGQQHLRRHRHATDEISARNDPHGGATRH